MLIDESRYADAELAAQRNLVAALFRLENSCDPIQVQAVLTALVDWLASPEQRSLRRSFLVWLKKVFLKARLPGVELPEVHDLEEMRDMLADRVEEWTRDWKQQGLQQGLQSERNLVLRLVRRRFGPALMERRAPLLEGVRVPEQLEQLGEAVLDCKDEADWLARLEAAQTPPPE